MSVGKRPLKVFLAHASQDKPAVSKLYRYLRSQGIDPWLDSEKLLPGQNWQMEIPKALENSDAIIICLSKSSVNKEGYVQREIKFILDRALEQPEGRIFLIPARLEECDVPSNLNLLQWVDLFSDDGFKRLMLSLNKRAAQLGPEVNQAIISDRTLERDKAAEKRLAREKAEREALEKSALETVKREVKEKLVLEKANREAREKSKRETKSEIKRPTKYYSSYYIPILVGAILLIVIALFYNRLMGQILKLLQGFSLTNFLVIITIPLGVLFAGFIVYTLTVQISKAISNNKSNKIKTKFTAFKNPYIAGNPVDPALNPRMFFGRSDVVQMVYKEIKEPSQKPSLLLYGRRRMGKTSALLNLGKLMRDLSIVDIYISAQDIKYRTDSDLVFNLIKIMTAKLRGALSLKQLFENENKYLSEKNYQKKPILMLSSFFEECNKVLEKNSLYCLLMFDEYELLGKAISNDFFMQIRDTMQHKPRLVFLFSGTHMPTELPNSNWMEVFMNVKVLPISFLDRQDSYKLLTEPVPGLRYSNENVIRQILDETGCQPLLLQSVATEIVNKLNLIEKKIVNGHIVDYAIEKTIDSWGYNFFKHLWDADCNLLADKELLKMVAMRNNKIKVSAISNYIPSLNKLVERDLLIVQDGYVKLTMPIVSRWIQRENPEMH